MKRILSLGMLLTAVLISPARPQDHKTPGAEPEQEPFSYLMPGVFYVSDAVFMGRRDSVAAPYLMPSLGYYHKSGLYAEASASYLLASGEGRVDLFMLGGGYQFEAGKFSGSLSGTAYFFDDASYNVKSETAGDLTAELAYDWDWVETSIRASGYFNQEGDPDYFLGVGLRRSWFAVENRLLLQPGISMFAGTQRFYEAYYSSSRLGNRKGNPTGPGGTGSSTTDLRLEEVASFKVLNLEVEFPAHYFHKHFIFSLYPSLAFPQSPARVTTEEGTFEEDLSPTFYLIAGISFWLGSP